VQCVCECVRHLSPLFSMIHRRRYFFFFFFFRRLITIIFADFRRRRCARENKQRGTARASPMRRGASALIARDAAGALARKVPLCAKAAAHCRFTHGEVRVLMSGAAMFAGVTLRRGARSAADG